MNLYDLHYVHSETQSHSGLLGSAADPKYMVPELAYDEAWRKPGRRDDALERAIARCPWTAYKYAREIRQGRFARGEPTIATDAETAYLYALYVIGGRFPEGEPVLATKDPAHACLYAVNVIEGRWKEAEPTIRGSDYWPVYIDRINDERINSEPV